MKNVIISLAWVILLSTAEVNSKRRRVTVADQQLNNLIKQIWDLDTNRIKFGSDFRLSYQGQVSRSASRYDNASCALFMNLDECVFQKPTYKAFISLLNNYVTTTSQLENDTDGELSEVYNFFNLVINTPGMNLVYSYLKNKGKVSNLSVFKKKIYNLWFKPYWSSSKYRIQDSSGFEHVFVGELKYRSTKVTGFHNWIQFYLEEQIKNINYLGYLKKGSSPHVLIMKFTWNNHIKRISSMFVGTSPEFEIAIYTLVYMLNTGPIQFSLDGTQMKITCFGINRGRSIRTCYPDIV